MTSVSPAGGVRATLLVNEDHKAIRVLLARDLRGTVYLRSLIHEYGISPTEELGHGRFYGYWRRDSLEAVAFVGNARNMTTVGEPEDVEVLMDRVYQSPYRPRLFVGPEEHAGPVRRLLLRDGLNPRLDRGQSYYVLDRGNLQDLEPLEVRRAAAAELDAVVTAHAAMIREDLKIPAPHLDLDRLHDLAAARIEDGKIWVHVRDDRLVFKTEEISRSEDAILVGGVYTDPLYRGQGYASRGMASWARQIFNRGLERLALHVNADNLPAYRAYERTGFERHSMLRLILTY